MIPNMIQDAAAHSPDKPKRKGVKRLIGATYNSLEGLVSAFKSEEAIRGEIVITILLLPLIFFTRTLFGFDLMPVEHALLVFSLLMVMMAELVNTSIEAIVDRVSEQYHELSKRAKDVASGAVLLSIVAAVAIWSIIFWPKFF